MWTALVLASALIVQDVAPAQPNELTPQAQRALEIIAAVDEATRAVKTARYEAESYGVGSFAAIGPVISATVTVAKNDQPFGAYRAEGNMFFPRGERGVRAEFAAASDGEFAMQHDTNGRVNRISRFGAGADPAGRAVLMLEFSHPTPFSDEMNGQTLAHEGRTDVHGVLCDVIFVQYAEPNADQHARWYFGVDDHLPRRVERLGTGPAPGNRPGARVLSIRNLEVDVDVSDVEFTLETPEGYSEQRTVIRN